MVYDVNATYKGSQVGLNLKPIDLYVINASPTGWNPLYYTNYNQDVFGWVINASGDLQNEATKFTGLPIGRNDFESNIQGEIGEVTISIPNTDRVMESVIQNYNYLRGMDVFIITTFAQHLPASSLTAEYIGSESDHRAAMVEKVYVDSTTSNKDAVSFICKTKFSLRNAVLPSRTYMRECTWAYKSKYLASECDPNSDISATIFPTCDGTLDSCKLRGNEARYGGFPAIPRRGFYI